MEVVLSDLPAPLAMLAPLRSAQHTLPSPLSEARMQFYVLAVWIKEVD